MVRIRKEKTISETGTPRLKGSETMERTLITPVFLVKKDEKILDKWHSMEDAKESLHTHVMEDLDVEDTLNDYYSDYSLGSYSWTPYEIASEMNNEDEIFEELIDENMEEISDSLDVGDFSYFELEDSYSISCGLLLVDDLLGSYVFDNIDLCTIGKEPREFKSVEGKIFKLALIDEEYYVLHDAVKEHTIYIIRVQPDGVPIVAGSDEFGKDKEGFEARILELSTINAMLLNIYEDDEKVVATFYL